MPSLFEAARFGCVLCRTEFREPQLVRPLPAPLQAALHRLPSLCGFVAEMHNFLHRMAAIYRLRYRTYLLYVGPLEQGSAAHVEPNIRTHACIRDMRSFSATHPWATILDLEIYRDAWLAGVEWAESNSYKQEQEKSRDLTCGTPTL
jgi:hypothetical protein